MKIGIDAKWYFTGNPSGQVVVRNIVDNILKQSSSEHEFILFIPKQDKLLAQKLEQKCAQLSNISIVYCFSTVNFISNILLLPFYLKKHKIEVCLFQNFTPFLFHRRIRYIAYIHDFLFFDFPQYYSLIERLIFPLMRVTSKFASDIITISSAEKKRILKYTRHTPPKVHVVHHGISHQFSPNNIDTDYIKNLKLPNSYILFLGRINTRKNIQIILDAIAGCEELPTLVIIGKKDHKTFDIERYIKEKGISKRVILLGHLEFDELLKILASASVFVFPSFAEGFGLPPLEAMKSGVPVVVSNSTCLPEVCGDAALYFEPSDTNQLTKNIQLILNNESLRLRMIEKGLRHAENFDWQLSTSKILSIIATK